LPNERESTDSTSSPAALRLRRTIRDDRIDVVHAHTAHAIGVAALATIGMEIPLVVARRVDFHLRRNFGTRWKYGRAAGIIAVSRAVASILESDGIASSRIAVVADGTDTQRQIAAASPETLASLGLRRGAPLVVQVAQLERHKDPCNFVRAIAVARSRVPNLQALLVGEGSLRAEVESEVHALDLVNTLYLAGYRTDADGLLAAADVVVLSSREEGMGSVLLDALLLGKPVAATNAGGIPDVIADGVNGLLASIEDPQALGDRIAQLLSDESTARRVAQAARSSAEEFSVERMTDRTLAVYERVLAGLPLSSVEETARFTDATSRSSSPSSMRAP
jgi:glycosyltransferase involved in cell wall biosynthesis